MKKKAAKKSPRRKYGGLRKKAGRPAGNPSVKKPKPKASGNDEDEDDDEE